MEGCVEGISDGIEEVEISGGKRAKGERQRGQGERLMSNGGPKFKELRVWQKGKDHAVYIYQITKRNF